MFTRQTSSHLRVCGAATAAALALAVAASAALAASSSSNGNPIPAPQVSSAKVTPADRCKIYEGHFDTAVATHADSPRIDEARVLRIEGGKLCGSGEYTRGSVKLREALEMIDLDIPF